jgi:hypothetical protein
MTDKLAAPPRDHQGGVGSPAGIKRRLRRLLGEVERFHRELTAMEQGLPAPGEEELGRMLKREAPLTMEAWLVGALRQLRVHLAEVEDLLSLTVTTTGQSLRRDWEREVPLPQDLVHSLRDVVKHRQR